MKGKCVYDSAYEVNPREDTCKRRYQSLFRSQYKDLFHKPQMRFATIKIFDKCERKCSHNISFLIT